MGLLDGFFERGRAAARQLKGKAENRPREQGAAQATPAAPPKSEAPSPAAAQRTYTVQPGDTLSRIAERYYGDATAYGRIFDANRDKLSNPDKIFPGQVLTIP